MATQTTKQPLQFIPLSPLDNVMPRVYTRIILCIQTEKTADSLAVIALLSKALRRTVEQVPLLDGEVVPDTTNPDRLGRLAVRVSQPNRLRLQSKDLSKRSDAAGGGDWKWSFQDLAHENWLPGRFDGNILSPINAFPDPFDESPAVMAAQANFIDGGLLLCAAFHHQVMDGTGVGTVLRLWAQNCREIETDEIGDNNNVAKKTDNVDCNDARKFKNDVDNKILAASNSAIVITPAALDRTLLMPSGKTDTERSVSHGQHPEYEVEQAPSTTSWIGTVPDTEIEIFYFSADALGRLKDAAKADPRTKIDAKSGRPTEIRGGFHGHSVPWISTNDALSAVLWSSITRARLRQATEDAVAPLESKLGMANNGRRKLDPPLQDAYVGNVNLYSLAILPIPSLMLEEALPNVAQSVRVSVNSVNDEHIRSAARFIDSLPDITALKPGFAPFMGPDLAITSWAELGLNGLDWGRSVGIVERVRVPAMKFDGLCIVLPRTRDGGLEVLVGLTVDVMKGLARDEFFMSFAQVVGGLHNKDHPTALRRKN